MGQQHQFLAPEPSARYRFGKETLVGTRGKEREAPIAAVCSDRERQSTARPQLLRAQAIINGLVRRDRHTRFSRKTHYGADTIEETARGDPDALAARIVAALAEAGFLIVSANGRENSAGGRQREETRQLYHSPNGDTWFLARDPATGSAFVRHQANAPSGGRVTDTELGAFLSGPRNPEHEALLRLIGATILDPRGAEVDDAPAAVNPRREWSDGELNELGNMLVRGLSIEEIAGLLRRDHGEVQDKVAELGR